MTLRPFLSFYGGKWRAAKHYPVPQHAQIIEPFAGSAGYALRYPERRVLLIDADPIVAGVWRYLIHARESEVRSLPARVASVDDYPNLCPEARWLIGFWLNKGAAAPCKTPSAWMRRGTHDTSFWGPAIRERIASQQHAIRHWEVLEGTYLDAPDSTATATWFIDPPYSTPAGRHYRVNTVTDYAALADWCRARLGQVVVCEQEGADWLPFRPFRAIKGNESSRGKHVSHEVIWP